MEKKNKIDIGSYILPKEAFIKTEKEEVAKEKKKIEKKKESSSVKRKTVPVYTVVFEDSFDFKINRKTKTTSKTLCIKISDGPSAFIFDDNTGSTKDCLLSQTAMSYFFKGIESSIIFDKVSWLNGINPKKLAYFYNVVYKVLGEKEGAEARSLILSGKVAFDSLGSLNLFIGVDLNDMYIDRICDKMNQFITSEFISSFIEIVSDITKISERDILIEISFFDYIQNREREKLQFLCDSSFAMEIIYCIFGRAYLKKAVEFFMESNLNSEIKPNALLFALYFLFVDSPDKRFLFSFDNQPAQRLFLPLSNKENIESMLTHLERELNKKHAFDEFENIMAYIFHSSSASGYVDNVKFFISEWRRCLAYQHILFGKIMDKYPLNLFSYNKKLSFDTEIQLGIFSYDRGIYRPDSYQRETLAETTRKLAEKLSDMKSFEFASGGYGILVPDSLGGLCETLRFMSNGASVFNNMYFLEGKSFVFFVYDTNDSTEKPVASFIYDFEYDECEKAYGFKNLPLSDNVEDFIKDWACFVKRQKKGGVKNEI